MQVKAEARYIRISPQKARLVVDLMRGKQAGAALTTLRTFHGLGRTEARALLFDAAQRAAAPDPKPAPVINHPDWSKPWTNPA